MPSGHCSKGRALRSSTSRAASMTGGSARLTERLAALPSQTLALGLALALGLGHDTNINALLEKTAFNLLT